MRASVRHIVARIAGGSSKIERKVLEPQVAIDPPWSYIMDDDKKQDAPIVISDDEDDDVVIISETHTRKSRRHVSLYDYLDQQHIGAVGVRPRVEVCRWNGCTIGPHRDRAEMRNHLQHHAPDARPWSCNGAAVQASSTATLAPHTIVCALTSKLSPNGTPVNSQHATTHPTTLGIT
ncbi:unnamed protein product [Aureobasidium pullulans]|nr:unnamed protein product [Aureobasidium pullulans]